MHAMQHDSEKHFAISGIGYHDVEDWRYDWISYITDIRYR